MKKIVVAEFDDEIVYVTHAVAKCFFAIRYDENHNEPEIFCWLTFIS